MYFFMLNGKTLSTVLNNQLCNKKNYVDIINLYFLILNKRTLYFKLSSGTKMTFFIFTLVPVIHLTEWFNVRD